MVVQKLFSTDSRIKTPTFYNIFSGKKGFLGATKLSLQKSGDCRPQCFGWMIFSGGTPVSNADYWEGEEVRKIITEKLAIDWLRVNKSETKDHTPKRITACEKCYEVPTE